MPDLAMLDYFYGDEAEQFTFYRIPKVLFTDPSYRRISSDAKILYGLMLDRMGLSVRNGWLDEYNRVFIFFTLEDALEYLCCGHTKAVSLFGELDKAGLIERKKQGQGKPTKIYVKNFVRNAEVLTSEKRKSKVPQSGSQDFQKTASNNTEIKDTELSDTEPSIHPARGLPEDKSPAADAMDTMRVYRQISIDHRSYERQGVELLPTVHEGATVRAMEKKGIRTEKGEFNRWIRATNAVIRDIKKKIALLFDWIAEAKAELAKPQAPDLVSLLNAYYTQRRAGAYSQKGKISNLKEMNETFNYLRRNGIYSLEDLESRVSEHSAATESLKKTLDEQTARMKAIKRLYDSSAAFQNLKPVYDGLQKIKLEKPRAKYKAEHEAELIQFYAARRKLTGEFPDGKVDMKKLSDEYDELEQAHNTTYGEFKTVRDDLHRLWKVKSCVDTAARFNERTEEQKLQNRPQTRQKKEDMTR